MMNDGAAMPAAATAMQAKGPAALAANDMAPAMAARTAGRAAARHGGEIGQAGDAH